MSRPCIAVRPSPRGARRPALGPQARWVHLGAALLLALAALPARADEPVVLPRGAVHGLEGPGFAAALVEADDAWRLRFQAGLPTADAPAEPLRDLRAADLVAWGAPVEPRGAWLVLLAEGSCLVADRVEANVDALTLSSPLWGQRVLPLERVEAVVARPPEDAPRRDRLLDALRTVAEPGWRDRDRVVFPIGDYVLGTVSRLSPQGVELESDAGPLSIEPARVAAVAFHPALVDRSLGDGLRGGSELRAVVGLSDGSWLVVRRLIVRGGRAEVEPLALRDLPPLAHPAPDNPAAAVEPAAAPEQAAAAEAADPPGRWSFPAQELIFVQPLGGRAVYLSDLEPAAYRHLPYLNRAWPYMRDRNVEGLRLRAGGRPYFKGLGMHSTARLSYRLDRPFRRFEAELAIDDATAGGGSVTGRVFLDGRPVYQSEIVRGGGRVVPVVVELGGARELSLVVDFAERADELDRANWLNARLIE